MTVHYEEKLVRLSLFYLNIFKQFCWFLLCLEMCNTCLFFGLSAGELKMWKLPPKENLALKLEGPGKSTLQPWGPEAQQDPAQCDKEDVLPLLSFGKNVNIKWGKKLNPH